MHQRFKMSDARDESRSSTRPLSAPFLAFDLKGELERLHGEAAWTSGHASRTLVKFDDFRVVLMTVRAGTRIPEHQTKGRLSIYTVSGRIRVRAAGRTFDLGDGALLALDQGAPHDVEAVDDSAFLLTIAWRS
jgi:quercetin dioxygenase-like cupin family protein